MGGKSLVRGRKSQQACYKGQKSSSRGSLEEPDHLQPQFSSSPQTGHRSLHFLYLLSAVFQYGNFITMGGPQSQQSYIMKAETNLACKPFRDFFLLALWCLPNAQAQAVACLKFISKHTFWLRLISVNSLSFPWQHSPLPFVCATLPIPSHSNPMKVKKSVIKRNNPTKKFFASNLGFTRGCTFYPIT